VGAEHAITGLPTVPEGIFLMSDDLKAFRDGPVEPTERDPRAPGVGFIAVNKGDELRYFLIDGVPVAAVPAMSERYVVGTQPGSYVTQWRTSLGDQVDAPRTVTLPGRIVFGD